MVIKAEGNDAPHSWLRLYPLAVTTLAEARVLRADDCTDEKYPGALVLPGAPHSIGETP